MTWCYNRNRSEENGLIVKCWKIELKEGGGTSRKDGKANSNGFLRCETGGVPTPDLVVTEFWRGYGQTDLASAYVLRPLNLLVLDFEVLLWL